MSEILDETPEEQWRILATKFRERNQARLRSFSQYRPLLEDVLQKVRDRAKSEGLDVWELASELQDGEQIVEDIADALRAFWNEPPEDRF